MVIQTTFEETMKCIFTLGVNADIASVMEGGILLLIASLTILRQRLNNLGMTSSFTFDKMHLRKG